MVAGLLTLTACLLAMNGILTLLYFGTSPSAQGQPDDELPAKIAARFYDAVNAALLTGNTDPVAALLAPEYAQYPAYDGAPSDRSALLASLGPLRVIAPGLRLRVESVTEPSPNGQVVIRLTVTGAETGSFLGLAPPRELSTWGWGPVETLRIVGGLIVTRWSEADAAARLKPLARTAVPPVDSSSPRLIALLRLTIAPHAQLAIDNDQAARFWVVESGTLSLSTTQRPPHGAVSGQGGYVVPTQPPFAVQPPRQLAAGGDLLTLPEETYLAGNASATPLSLFVAVYLPITATMSTPSAFAWRVRLFSPESGEVVPGVTERLLAIAFAPGETSETLALGKATLAPQATLTWSENDRPALLAVDDGQLNLTTSDSKLTGTRADGSEWRGNNIVLQPGDGAFVADRVGVTWRATSDAPVVVDVLTLGPADAAPASPVTTVSASRTPQG